MQTYGDFGYAFAKLALSAQLPRYHRLVFLLLEHSSQVLMVESLLLHSRSVLGSNC